MWHQRVSLPYLSSLVRIHASILEKREEREKTTSSPGMGVLKIAGLAGELESALFHNNINPLSFCNGG